MNQKVTGSAFWSAAFLMATSAIGPGFLTQTAVFTQKLTYHFGFVILVSILLDLAVQLNIWRVLIVTGKKAQEVANLVFPGMGYVLSALIVFGGIAFNIGNLAGCGLGLQALLDWDIHSGTIFSAVLALFLFWIKESEKAVDFFVKILGLLMIAVTFYIVCVQPPDLAKAAYHTFFPATIDTMAILTLVGGTVGGYISFAGAHKLLNAGIQGKEAVENISFSAVQAILLTSLMRILLFLAALGVVTSMRALHPDNPAASLFHQAAGALGYRFFGLVMWSAAITSVVGSSYTSVSFVSTFHPWLHRHQRWFVTFFILFSMCIFLFRGKPVDLLVLAGTLNSLILPLALLLILTAIYKLKLNSLNGYRHPQWLLLSGILAFFLLLWMSVDTFLQLGL